MKKKILLTIRARRPARGRKRESRFVRIDRILFREINATGFSSIQNRPRLIPSSRKQRFQCIETLDFGQPKHASEYYAEDC